MLINEEDPDRDEDGWFVSSRTTGGGSCVEVKFAAQGAILVRDSKDRRPDSPVISVFPAGWTPLLRWVAAIA